MATLGSILSGFVNKSEKRERRSSSLLITNGGLRLEMPTRLHYSSWRDIRKANRDFLQPWEPKWTNDETSLSSFHQRIAQAERNLRRNQGASYLLVLPDTKEPIGGISLFNIRPGSAKSGAIGYWLAEQFNGQGHMSDAVDRLCEYGFNQLELERIEAACLPSNLRSIKLLKKCNFQQEGICRSYLQINGKREDHLLFARLK